MSQQVYSAGGGYTPPQPTVEENIDPNIVGYATKLGPDRYLPRASQTDYLTLIKNVNPGTAGEYGTATKNLAQTGTGLAFNRLNGNDTAVTGGIVNFQRYQNPDTKPYWLLSGKSDVLGGATLLYAKCDNVIACNAVIPGSFPGSGGNVPFKLMFVVMNAANVILRNFALTGDREVLGNTSDDPFSCSAVIPILAGQKLALFGYATGNSFRYEDDLASNPSITVQCQLSFTKM